MKCLNEKKVNKCEDFCDTSTGQCYKSTSKGVPWGFEKKNINNDLVYDKEHRLFGKKNDVDMHIKKMNSLSPKDSISKKNIFKTNIQNDVSIDRFVSKELHELYVLLNTYKI